LEKATKVPTDVGDWKREIRARINNKRNKTKWEIKKEKNETKAKNTM
jgi:hypothetical protein